jgi:hypothetical protein
LKQTEIQNEMQAKIEEDKRKELFEKKALEKRAKILLEEKRMKELEKAVLEDIEEQNKRKRAQAL